MNEQFLIGGSARSAIVIGAFDAVHRGHRALMSVALEEAKKRALSPMLITFDPLPGVYFNRLGSGDLILTGNERIAMLSGCGFERVITMPFDQKLANTSAEDFFSYLAERVDLGLLIVGDDFALGKNRGGTIPELNAIGSRYHCEVKVVPRLESDGAPISASRIRALLKDGKMREAEQLLGYEYFFENEVIHGDARGRTLGIPTINQIIPQEKIIPPKGVYAARLEINGRTFPAVTNVGTRPTFTEGDEIFVESYLLRGGDDFYGDFAKLSFSAYLRPEITFPDADTLVRQIQKDIKQAECILECR